MVAKPMTYGELITSLRTDANLTQSELAVQMKCHRQQINSVEQGKRTLSVELESTLVTTLKLSAAMIDYLCYLKGLYEADKRRAWYRSHYGENS